MTRRSLFRSLIAAAAGTVLAKTPLAGWSALDEVPGATPWSGDVCRFPLYGDRYTAMAIEDVLQRMRVLVKEFEFKPPVGAGRDDAP